MVDNVESLKPAAGRPVVMMPYSTYLVIESRDPLGPPIASYTTYSLSSSYTPTQPDPRVDDKIVHSKFPKRTEQQKRETESLLLDELIFNYLLFHVHKKVKHQPAPSKK
jgi:hypothetical protein